MLRASPCHTTTSASKITHVVVLPSFKKVVSYHYIEALGGAHARSTALFGLASAKT